MADAARHHGEAWALAIGGVGGSGERIDYGGEFWGDGNDGFGEPLPVEFDVLILFTQRRGFSQFRLRNLELMVGL
jgi:hypothetical protein